MTFGELLAFDFMRHAMIAGLLAAVPCGVVGSLVVANRIVFLAEGIAHSAFGGIGIALLLGLPPMLGAGAASLACALAVGAAALGSRHRADAAVGVFMATSMSAGVLALDLAPGYRGDPLAFLFGSILAVSRDDLAAMALLSGLVVGAVALFYRPILAVSHDPDFARSRGVPVGPVWLLLHALVALGVILVVRLAGVVLFLALVTIPPLVAERRSASLAGMMARASLLCALLVEGGLLLAARFNTTAGATIVLLSAAVYFADRAAAGFSGRPA